MKIFLTNDDGYLAPGIKCLEEISRGLGQVQIVAPKHAQSGTSMAVDLGDDLQIAYKKISSDTAYLDAMPASCVKFLIRYTPHSQWPDVVLSGINHGNNASTGACYSGTLGACEEAALNGMRAIGVSINDESQEPDFQCVREYFPTIFSSLVSSYPDGKGIYYNVNFPAMRPCDIKGVKVSYMGPGHWEKEFMALDIPQNENGETFYRMCGYFVDDSPKGSDCDYKLLQEGYIVITPLLVDNTSYKEVARLKKIWPDK